MKNYLINEIKLDDVNWSGWEISNNPFGKEFDEAARIRMIKGSRALNASFIKYSEKIGPSILEIGPFFNPLIKQELFLEILKPESSVVFLENDIHAINWLRNQYLNAILNIDLNDRLLENLIDELKYTTEFNTIIMSQIINYIDFEKVLTLIYKLLEDKGTLFINNAIDYGLPTLFSPLRPVSNEQVIQVCHRIGFKILEHRIVESDEDKMPKERLIMVLEK